MAQRIVTLPGDGIGPEIMLSALAVLDEVGNFAFDERVVRRRRHRRPRHRPAPTTCSRPAAAPTPSSSPPSAAPSGTPRTPTRRAPSRACSACARASAFRQPAPGPAVPGALRRQPAAPRGHRGHDLLVVRELTGGHLLRRARPRRRPRVRHVRVQRGRGRPHRPGGFDAAEARVTSVDKANVLETSRLWREVVTNVHSERVSERPARAHAGRQRGHAARRRTRATST